MDNLDVADTVEAGLVRARDLLDRVLVSLPGDAMRDLVAQARREVDELALLVPAIGRVTPET